LSDPADPSKVAEFNYEVETVLYHAKSRGMPELGKPEPTESRPEPEPNLLTLVQVRAALLVKLWCLLQMKEHCQKSTVDLLISLLTGEKKLESPGDLNAYKWEEWLNWLSKSHGAKLTAKEHFIFDC
jgi:hypothetical protein